MNCSSDFSRVGDVPTETASYVAVILFLFAGVVLPLLVFPIRLLCGVSRTEHMKRAFRRKRDRRIKEDAKSLENPSSHADGNAPVALVVGSGALPPPIDQIKYPAGDADVVHASQHAGFSLEELVSVVHQTGDTTFAFGPAATFGLFDIIDRDQSQTLSLDEIVEARADVNVMAFLRVCNSPVVSSFFQGSRKEVQRRLTRHRLLAMGGVTREAWGKFIEGQEVARLVYYKSAVLGDGKFYYGKGMEPTFKSRLPLLDAFLWAVVPRGWLQDFKHHLVNTHPLLSVCFASSHSQFTSFERMLLFWIDLFVCLNLSIMNLVIIYHFCKTKRLGSNARDSCEDLNGIWAGLLCVTIPQVVFQRFLNGVASQWAARDDSARKESTCACKLARFGLETCARNFLYTIFAALAAASVGSFHGLSRFVLHHPESCSSMSKLFPSVTKNLFGSYFSCLVWPLVQEYNPSFSVYEFGMYLKQVRAEITTESWSLVGARVAFFNGTGAKSRDFLSVFGAGKVDSVDTNGNCVVLLDEPCQNKVPSSRLCWRISSGSAVQKVSDNLVAVGPVDLARLDWEGSKVVVVAPGQSEIDGNVGMCGVFNALRGCYSITLNSGGEISVPVANVYLLDVQDVSEPPPEVAAVSDDDIRLQLERNSQNSSGAVGKGSVGSVGSGSPFAEQSLQNQVEGTDPGVASKKQSGARGASLLKLLLCGDEAGLRERARKVYAAAEKGAVDAKSFGSVAMSRAESAALQAAKHATEAASVASKLGAKSYNEAADAVAAKAAAARAAVAARAASELLVRHAKTKARAKHEAKKFARHPMGQLVAPVLGWLLLDYWKVGSWSRERAGVLAVIRDAILERGAANICDPFTAAREIKAREDSARFLDAGETVVLVGPTAEPCAGASPMAPAESVVLLPKGPIAKGTHGVIVSGGSKSFGKLPHLVARGFHYRHLTPNFKVYVMFPVGLRAVPANWLHATSAAKPAAGALAKPGKGAWTFDKEPPGSASQSSGAPRSWRGTQEVRERQWQQLGSQRDVELSAGRLSTYNALAPKPPAKTGSPAP